jgi:Holliday junction resolvasome RuvABC endonuclease subunit
MKGHLNWLTIDPGLRRTGWALWRQDELVEWGLVTSRDLTTVDWKLTAHLMGQRVYQIATRYSVSFVLSEMPEEHMSGKGRAALNSGSVRKLAYYVGLLNGALRHVEFQSIEPSRWKGTVPKEVTTRRVLRSYPQVPADLMSDVYDAIAIGRWKIRKSGKLNR